MTKLEVLTYLSKKYLLAKEEYERAMQISIQNAPIMHNKTQFWAMVDDLRELIYAYEMKQSGGVKAACEEFVRKAYAEGGNGYGFFDLQSFIRTYGKLKETLGRRLNSKIENWSEIVDSLPLAGQRVCLRVINEDSIDANTLKEIIAEDASRFADIVLNKEQFVEQRLEEGYSDKVCEILTSDDEDFALKMENADPPTWEDENDS